MQLTLLAAVVVVAALATADPFADFVKKFHKHYATAQEKAYRRVVFEHNMAVAARQQARNPHAKFGASIFADLTAAEFKSRHNLDFTEELKTRKPTPNGPLPKAGESIDWRTRGAVTGVKNQGSCGSCWSFSTTGNIEGQWFLAGNTLVSLSEQQLVSCDTIDDGCSGGLPSNAYQWLLNDTAGAIVTEASDPYESGSGSSPGCPANPGTFGARINGWKAIPSNEADMAQYMYTNGPISIGVDGTSFQTYLGGILTNCESGQLDHAVLIVGYDATNSPPYWVIKNSWGTSWGESGYIRVEYGTDQCGLTQAPTSATVARAGPVPPSPPVPPTPPPTPAPAPSEYTVSVCADPFCILCQSSTQNNGACVAAPFQSSASFSAKCISSGSQVSVTGYSAAGCTGSATKTVVDTNTCSADGTDYIKFVC